MLIAFLSQMRHLFEGAVLNWGDAYLSKYSILTVKIMPPFPLDNFFITLFLTCCAQFWQIWYFEVRNVDLKYFIAALLKLHVSASKTCSILIGFVSWLWNPPESQTSAKNVSNKMWKILSYGNSNAIFTVKNILIIFFPFSCVPC